jgi:hypothetical protein
MKMGREVILSINMLIHHTAIVKRWKGGREKYEEMDPPALSYVRTHMPSLL